MTIKKIDAHNNQSAQSTAETMATDAQSVVAKNKNLDSLRQYVTNTWSELSRRDQMALIILMLFLLFVGGGYAGRLAHHSANEQNTAYQAAINDYFWLRNQVANIDPVQNQQQLVTLSERVNHILLKMQSIDPQVLTVGEKVQISFSHNNQTVASEILTTLANSGLYIEQLNMQQNPEDKSIQVQATVSE